MSESVDLLLTNGTVVTMDSGGNVFLDGAVAIRGRAMPKSSRAGCFSSTP